MTQAEIVQELKKLSVPDRLAVLESALHLLEEDLRQCAPGQADADLEQRLALAAEVVRGLRD